MKKKSIKPSEEIKQIPLEPLDFNQDEIKATKNLCEWFRAAKPRHKYNMNAVFQESLDYYKKHKKPIWE
jgi:hypothetical protein